MDRSLETVTTISPPLANDFFQHWEEPLRTEIRGLRRLEETAEELAQRHLLLFDEKGDDSLFRRFEENVELITKTYRNLSRLAQKGKTLAPSEEWLVDNYYLVAEQIREIREDLPREFYDELPKLENAESYAVPRVYILAAELVANTDSLLDSESLKAFIRAYQKTGTPLTIGEIWALPIALRLVLIDNLRRISVLSEHTREERDRANELADRILQSDHEDIFAQTARLQKILASDRQLNSAWLVQLVRRLRNQDEVVSPILETIERKLTAGGYGTEQIFVLDQNQAAAAVVTIGNIIMSFRWLKAFDWSDFFENVSAVDEILRQDPAGVYLKMDFETRNRYRRKIEQIARRNKKNEIVIARRVVELSQEALKSFSAEDIRAHTGFYLLDDKNETLEREFGYQPPLAESIRRTIKKYPNRFYLSTIILVTILFTGFAAILVEHYAESWELTVLTAVLSIIPAITLAVSVLNWDTTKLFAPTILPKMDYSKGIPEAAATMVVIPTILDSPNTVREIIKHLEVHYLANTDPHLYFAVLSDFVDWRAEEKPSDAEILQTAKDEIAKLNLRYHQNGNAEKPRFHLFHRRRHWSETEKKWLAWERKRGKLEEFNRLLRGAENTSFITATLEPAERVKIQYVITLDSDTKLPPGTARKLVGIIAHPLNRPRFSGHQIERGFAVLQPRVSITAESTSKSVFAQIMAGFTGLDPYTTAASDVYQDLFGAGIYTGKGLYVVDAFERALENRIPPESLLSHDLFESLFARTALVSDIEFFDDYPTVYETHAKRLHRWVRGDWQLLPWLFPRVPTGDGKRVRNDLPLVSRWKIFDNLRRSLIAPNIFLFFAAVWIFLPAPPLFLTLLMVFVLAFPVYAHVSNGLMEHPRGVNWENRLESFSGELILNTLQFFLTLIFLPHQAVLMVDAIVRTVYRIFVSRKHLLEWTTAAQIEQTSKRDFRSSWRFMRSATILSAIIFALIAIFRPDALIVAAPFLVLWAVSPFFAFYINQMKVRETEPLEPKNEAELHSIARQTWRFFEQFIGAEDNWLPPDNFQEDPQPLIAHRTSPTNIGLLFLANVAANDFGYLGLKDLLERTGNTLETIGKLEKFHGHLLNWYDTQTLAPLYPKYISTVDSGNLAGHLIALKQSLLEKIDAPVFSPNVVEGLQSGWEEVKKRLRVIQRSSFKDSKTALESIKAEKFLVKKFLAKFDCDNPADANWPELFDSLEKLRRIVHDQPIDVNIFNAFEAWLDSFIAQVKSLHKDTEEFFFRQRFIRKDESGLSERLEDVRSLSDLSEIAREFSPKTSQLAGEIQKYAENAARAIEQIRAMAHLAEAIALEMDFKFLLDENQKVFAIGFNVSDNRRDNSFYDLLASEARLASFWAIAKDDAPVSHWFKLSRPETMLSAGRALVSWSGTMFEYLMPLLVMRSFTGTLLDQTYHAVVERQIEYGKLTKTPWGISEAGYNARDLQLNYQYAPFGVPGLGLKRGLSADLVVAPYATVLASMVAPTAALKNLQRLEETQALGNYGFYESIDFTPERLPENREFTVIKNYMAHHQGMSFIALHNVLHDNIMQKRFHRDALVKSVEILLQERAVQNAPLIEVNREEVSPPESNRKPPVIARRVFRTAQTEIPQIQMLSNRNYSVMITNSGSGFSVAENIAVTRWREDATRDCWGSFIYLSDAADAEKFWSAAYQPVCRKPELYEVAFSDDRAVFRRSDFGLTTQTEIIVSSEDNVEMRYVTLINESNRPREILVTSYAEIVLNTAAADAAHPAFSNLFVETEFIESEEAILARRRPRSEKEREIFGIHTAIVEGTRTGAVEFETDRAKFLGRNRTPANPAAILGDEPLSKSIGAVLDPIFSLRYRLRIPPQSKASVCFSTGIAFSRDDALRIADKYNNPHVFERESAMAWTKSRVEQRYLRIGADEVTAFQTIGANLLYSSPDFRAKDQIIRQNNRIQSNLWAYGVSGDLPILLVKVKSAEEIDFVKQMLRGQEYLRLKGLTFDLVILNLHPEGYAQNVQDELNLSVRTSGFQHWLNKPGGIFILRNNLLPEEDARLFEAIARVVFEAENGQVVQQLKKTAKREEPANKFAPNLAPKNYADEDPWIPALRLFNGIGGFTEDGREYVITLKNGRKTPAPWLNVIANGADFGFQISESGAGYTWAVNSRENRLTTWSNDFVSDLPSEVFYLRDEENGEIWSPLPVPIETKKTFVVKHGQGYSQFLHNSNGIKHDATFFVPLDASVKIVVLRIENNSAERRKLSLWHFSELILGVQREKSAPSVITAIDTNHQVLFAYNRYNNEFATRSAFLATNAKMDSYTCDRREFLGRNGSLEKPSALTRTNLLNQCNPKLDPCFATQTLLELEPGETSVIIFLLGETENDDQAREIVRRFRSSEECYRALNEVKAFWDKTLTRIEIKTPEESTNLLVNRWLLYQTLVCRVWARSAFYQSGGAFGFRDQLQDVMSLVHTNPEIVRHQILLAAERQFKEGDVQHWWHPPTGRGVRTRISDDLLWLPFVTAHYLKATGDTAILQEKLSFLEARELNAGEEDIYIVPAVSDEEADLFEHCRRAIERSLKFGKHKLPLMGSGDWNDGMNQVGLHGKGESVWLGWFLYAVLQEFAPICELVNDAEGAKKYRAQAEALRKNIEKNAWDGDWYRRAYFDNGTPLGSKENDECRIDAIAQSWSVISGAGDKTRAQIALDSVEKYLIKREKGIILLFTPPFDHGTLEPGYIKGYVPGVRENGGQYAHGALWTIIAYALADKPDLAAELFALINPINHARNFEEAQRYKNEPYIFTADIHNTKNNVGRGGWSWYTGSAAWAYRAVTEFMFGLQKRGSNLVIKPHFPRVWDNSELIYRFGETTYIIKYGFSETPNFSLRFDGNELQNEEIPLIDDGLQHIVEVKLKRKLKE
jgi:cyclic beta-1,2-glucan synthetase